MNHTRPRPRLAVFLLVLAAALAALAGCKGSSAAADHPTAAAAASSAQAAGHAEATSSGGQAIKGQAAAIAGRCKPAAGWQAMYPGVPGAHDARKTFIRCEKIPRGQVVAWGICVGKAYAGAPKGGPVGTPAENQRQTYLAGHVGTCTKNAQGKA
jgi:hypothetical protein